MHVIIAINELTYAEAIADFVIKHLWHDDTSFEVLSIVKPMKVGSVEALLPGPILDELMQKKMEAAKELVAKFVQLVTQQIDATKISTSVREGFPTDEILEEVSARQADILIVGSHARRGVERAFLGSVSNFLVGHAPCSVIVIRLPAHK